MTQTASRKYVGEVWVDSGQIIIVDPCYLDEWEDNEVDFDNKERRDFSYAGASNCTLEEQFGQIEHGAVASSSGFGDGCYPVYAELSNEGEWGTRVKSLTIEFF